MNSSIRVGFVGGPYDGCASATQRISSLCGQIEMPVSANVLRLLAGEPAGEETPIRAVASYRLAFTPEGPRYEFSSFHRVAGPQSHEFALWHHALLSAWNVVLSRRKA